MNMYKICFNSPVYITPLTYIYMEAPWHNQDPSKSNNSCKWICLYSSQLSSHDDFLSSTTCVSKNNACTGKSQLRKFSFSSFIFSTEYLRESRSIIRQWGGDFWALERKIWEKCHRVRRIWKHVKRFEN